MDELTSWSRREVPAGSGQIVYQRGTGSGVLVLHEIPGLEPDVVDFANAVVARGHTVWLPVLFGTPGAGFSLPNVVGDVWRFCVRREFSLFARGRTSPVVARLRGLAAALQADTGIDRIGVVGMCLTGGFALAMLEDESIVAPVLAEPSLPFATIGCATGRARRGRDLGLDEGDLEAARRGPQVVLGLRYRSDALVGARFGSLQKLLGSRFLSVELDGRGHSVLTKDRHASAVSTVLDFLDERLDGLAPAARDRDAAAESEVRAALARFAVVGEVVVSRHPYGIDVVVGAPLTDAEFTGVCTVVRDRFGVAPAVMVRPAVGSGTDPD